MKQTLDMEIMKRLPPQARAVLELLELPESPEVPYVVSSR